MHSLKKGSARKPVLVAPQAAIGVVGNPSLCPAFRVRRGSGRKYGLMTGRARRATRPTPSEFRRPCGHGADFSCRRTCWGIARRPPRPALSRSSRRAWEHARSRAGTPTGARGTAGERGGTTESSADARDPMTTSPTKRAVVPNRCRRQPAARSWAIERSNVPSACRSPRARRLPSCTRTDAGTISTNTGTSSPHRPWSRAEARPSRRDRGVANADRGVRRDSQAA